MCLCRLESSFFKTNLTTILLIFLMQTSSLAIILTITKDEKQCQTQQTTVTLVHISRGCHSHRHCTMLCKHSQRGRSTNKSDFTWRTIAKLLVKASLVSTQTVAKMNGTRSVVKINFRRKPTVKIKNQSWLAALTTVADCSTAFIGVTPPRLMEGSVGDTLTTWYYCRVHQFHVWLWKQWEKRSNNENCESPQLH